MKKSKKVNIILKSALILGFLGFIFGYIGPLIFSPEDNLGPLMGIFLTGPVGFVFGGVIGFYVDLIQENATSLEKGRLLKYVPRIWNWVLWGCFIIALAAIVVGRYYIPIPGGKSSPNVFSLSDINKRDKSLTTLNVRFLSDVEILELQQFKQLYRLDFHRGPAMGEAKLTDEGLNNLTKINLPNLDWLMLGKCNKITDAGMQYVAKIENLKYLSIADNPQITDDGLLKLTSLSRLETLDMRGCMGVTDLGIGHLKKMSSLKRVMLGGCINITDNGMEDLKAALPNCKVDKDDKEWSWHTNKKMWPW